MWRDWRLWNLGILACMVVAFQAYVLHVNFSPIYTVGATHPAEVGFLFSLVGGALVLRKDWQVGFGVSMFCLLAVFGFGPWVLDLLMRTNGLSASTAFLLRDFISTMASGTTEPGLVADSILVLFAFFLALMIIRQDEARAELAQ